MTRKSTPFKVIARHLDQLTDRELRDVASMCEALIESREEERIAAEAEADRIENKRSSGQSGKKSAKGHIELKMINGFGPYKYLRYWSGKTLKSEYIGKAKK
jgi:hypothetical protein